MMFTTRNHAYHYLNPYNNMNFYTGLWVALVTPFKNGQIDEPALQNLVTELVNKGVNGFVPLGTTGEAATLSRENASVLFNLFFESARGVPVVPGCGSNSTAQTIEFVKEAESLHVRGAMVITPYYNKPTQEGLFQHFAAVAKSTKLPLMMYNVPGRTSVNMLPETVERLASFETIASIKEASGNLEQISEVCARVEGRMTVLSGDDSLTLPVLAVGGSGIVSVVGHVCPDLLYGMLQAWSHGDIRCRANAPSHLVAHCQGHVLGNKPLSG